MDPILQWLDENSAQMTEDLEQLCHINSGSDSVAGLANAATWLRNYFEPLGVPCETQPLKGFDAIDDNGASTTQQTGVALRWNLASGRLASADRKRILMNIHYDTVYGPDHPFQRCQRIAPDRLQGPGVIDAKGGIVVLRWGLLAAQRASLLSHLDVSVVLTPDEEIGSPASIALWREMAPRFDFAMLYEPTAADGSLISERKGTGTLIVVVRGKSAHSGRNFNDGRNAIVHASRIAVALHDLNGQRPNITINVGRVRGGDAVNVVPDLAVLRVNVRVASAKDQTWIESNIRSIIHSYHQPADQLSVELHGGIHAAPKVVNAEIRSWMDRIEQVGSSIGQDIRWKQSGGASDGNKLASLGLPNIDTFGPEGDLLHSSEEWVYLPSLPKKASLTYAFLKSLVET